MSYRTRRSRDPWFDRPFDRLTVLSKVEGVSRKPSSALDSPPQAGFATSGMTKSVPVMKELPLALPCSPKENPKQFVDQVLFFQPLPLMTRLTRAFPIVTSPGARKNRWILCIHLNTS
jgi:hypothetical protein